MRNSILKDKRVLLFSNQFPFLNVLEKSLVNFSNDCTLISSTNFDENHLTIDLLDTLAIDELLKKDDIIIFPYTLKSKDSLSLLYSTHVRGLQNLLNISLEKGIRKLFLINDVSYFGYSEKVIQYTEDSIVFGDSMTPAYMRVQQLMVEEVYRANQEGLDCTILTIGSNDAFLSPFASPYSYTSDENDLTTFFNQIFTLEKLDLRYMHFKKEIKPIEKKSSGFIDKLFRRTPKINRIELDNSKTNLIF